MTGFPRWAPGLAVVVASMLALFTVPREYFVAATFVSTACMMGVALALRGFKPAKMRTVSVALGLAAAALLYAVFFLGAAVIDLYHPFGITSGSEATIYSLIASPSNPLYLQVVLLLFDSAGYESFFRGVLQHGLQARVGVAAAPLVALIDAGLHLATLNPVWVGATFVTDLVWGLAYYYGKGAQSSFVSHFVWDIAIFVVRPAT